MRGTGERERGPFHTGRVWRALRHVRTARAPIARSVIQIPSGHLSFCVFLLRIAAGQVDQNGQLRPLHPIANPGVKSRDFAGSSPHTYMEHARALALGANSEPIWPPVALVWQLRHRAPQEN